MPIPTTESIHPQDLAYRLLLDEVGAFVYTTDLQGKYTYANQLVLDLLGQPLQAVLGKSFTDFVDIGENDTLRETDLRVLRHGETIAREETNLIHATGELRTYWSTKKPLRNAQGAITGLLGISHDITEKKRLEDQLRAQKELLDTVLDNTDALVYMVDEHRRFRYANRPMASAFGQSAQDIVGKLDTDLLPQEAADRFWAIDQHIMAKQERHTSEQALTDAQGHTRHYWSVVVPWTMEDGTDAVIGLSTDITELHHLKEELQHQAQTDSLTGIANRRAFFKRAHLEFARSRRQGSVLSLVAIDIDHFKNINDRYGHGTGDRVLQQFAQCCQRMLREVDLLARTGGEEFCILLPDTPLTAAFEVAERVRSALDHCPCMADIGPHIRTTASFGVAALQAQDPHFETLFGRADRALYAAKNQGRSRTVALE